MASIADVQFGFQNAKLLRLLAARATALKAANFEKASEIEAEMTKCKNENFDEINTPNYMFCTFNEEVGFLQAIEMGKFEFMGHKIGIKRAKQPSNILWENREYSQKEKSWRLCLAITFLIFFGIVIFMIATLYQQATIGY